MRFGWQSPSVSRWYCQSFILHWRLYWWADWDQPNWRAFNTRFPQEALSSSQGDHQLTQKSPLLREPPLEINIVPSWPLVWLVSSFCTSFMAKKRCYLNSWLQIWTHCLWRMQFCQRLPWRSSEAVFFFFVMSCGFRGSGLSFKENSSCGTSHTSWNSCISQILYTHFPHTLFLM